MWSDTVLLEYFSTAGAGSKRYSGSRGGLTLGGGCSTRLMVCDPMSLDSIV